MNVEPYFSRPPKNWQVLAWQLELQNSAGSLHCQTVFFFKLSLQNENDDELMHGLLHIGISEISTL